MKQREVQVDAPIPGMSLTAPLGGRPWQQPPQMATVEEAIDYYLPKLMDREFLPELLCLSACSTDFIHELFFSSLLIVSSRTLLLLLMKIYQ